MSSVLSPGDEVYDTSEDVKDRCGTPPTTDWRCIFDPSLSAGSEQLSFRSYVLCDGPTYCGPFCGDPVVPDLPCSVCLVSYTLSPFRPVIKCPSRPGRRLSRWVSSFVTPRLWHLFSSLRVRSVRTQSWCQSSEEIVHCARSTNNIKLESNQTK